MTNSKQDYEITIFKLKEDVINFTEKDVEYYREVKGISDNAVIIVKRADGTQDWY